VQRLWSLVILGAFLAAGPGVSGLEAGYHLLHPEGPSHGVGTHVEQAGLSTHADHCQVGLSSATRSAPPSTTPRHLLLVITRHDVNPWQALRAATQPLLQPFSRGPPSLV